MTLSTLARAPSTAVQAALLNPNFGKNLPPLSKEAKQLLSLSDDDKKNPKMLALIARGDPIYLGRLLSYANSVVYVHLDLVSSAEAAVRRLGVSPTYTLLLTSALAFDLEKSPQTHFCRNYILRYTMSLTATTSKVAQWLALEEQKSTTIWLAALLYTTGLFAGLISGGELEDEFKAGLTAVAEKDSFNLGTRPELNGFLQLSATVAEHWGMAEPVVLTLADASRERPLTAEGKLVQASSLALQLGAQSLNEAPALHALHEAGLSPALPDSRMVSLASVFR
jgi:HD-like signal output (HDOD) protein